MRAVIVVAKEPREGFGKSRLVSDGFDAGVVRRLADAFVRDTLGTCERLPDSALHVCYAPSEADAYFRELAPRAFRFAQLELDLGARLLAAFETVFARGASRVVMIGTDTPHLEGRTIERAFQSLEDADCVFGPAEDGGYYLIALRSVYAGLFRDVEWSTDRVLEQSLDRARELGLRVKMLEPMFDIDRAADVLRLESMLDGSDELCPHTMQILAELRSAKAHSSSDRRRPQP